MKHTPGPWTFRPNPSKEKCKTCNQNIPDTPWNYLIEGKARSLIAKIWVPVGNPYSDEANAKLIAAAPDLLEALQKMEESAIALADAAPADFKMLRNDLFADVHNNHLYALEVIKKATE